MDGSTDGRNAEGADPEGMYEGLIDRLMEARIEGWVWNQRNPYQRLQIVVTREGRILLEAEAGEPRADLRAAGKGDGRHAFDIKLSEPIPRDLLPTIRVDVKGTTFQVPRSARALEPIVDLADCQVNIANVQTLLQQQPLRFGHIRFDPNLDCNLHCVYCHNSRSKATVGADDLRAFVYNNVLSTEHFQMGCVMEPTLDPRLADLMLMVAASPAKPKKTFMLQTNGILLHRHDHQKMKAAGLTVLSVSVDAAEPDTQKLLRNGTSLTKVIRNVASFHATCPEIGIEFITTVTRANKDKLAPLIALGIEIGVQKFVFREVLYEPDNDIVDHTRMPELVLRDGEFAAVKRELIEEFGADVELVFADTEALGEGNRKMVADSRL